MCVKFSQVCGVISFQLASLAPVVFAQQSVHLTLGILRKSQAFFYALAFFWLDGFAVPRPSAGNANRWKADQRTKAKPSLYRKRCFSFGSKRKFAF